MPRGKGAREEGESNADYNFEWERRLAYKDKEAGWTVFRHLYWGIYLFVFGGLMVVAGFTAPNLLVLGGWLVILFAVFLVVYGFVASLHHRLMRKHG